MADSCFKGLNCSRVCVCICMCKDLGLDVAEDIRYKRLIKKSMCVWVCVCIYICTMCVCIYIYMKCVYIYKIFLVHISSASQLDIVLSLPPVISSRALRNMWDQAFGCCYD